MSAFASASSTKTSTSSLDSPKAWSVAFLTGGAAKKKKEEEEEEEEDEEEEEKWHLNYTSVSEEDRGSCLKKYFDSETFTFFWQISVIAPYQKKYCFTLCFLQI